MNTLIVWVCFWCDEFRPEWIFQGVFSTEEKALAVCSNEHYGIGPVELDKKLPEENVPWPGFYYPVIERYKQEYKQRMEASHG